MAKAETDASVEQLYERAKRGEWDDVLATFAGASELAGSCSRYCKRSSGWTFLHQAAYFGHEPAARVLIRVGASLKLRTKDGETPAGYGRRLRLLLSAAPAPQLRLRIRNEESEATDEA